MEAKKEPEGRRYLTRLFERFGFELVIDVLESHDFLGQTVGKIKYKTV